MSTGNVLPGIWKMGTLPKNAANLSESIVAEVTMSFKSVRRDTTWWKTVDRGEKVEWNHSVFCTEIRKQPTADAAVCDLKTTKRNLSLMAVR